MARIRLEVCETPNRCREVLLVKPIATIGRGAQCDVRIGGDAISSQHAKLRIYSTHAVIQDADSLNGVLVNGQRIHGSVEIGQGTVIQLGPGGPTVRILDGVPPVMAAAAGPAPAATPVAMAAPKTASTATYWILAACAGLMIFTSCTAVVVAVAWYAASSSQQSIASLTEGKVLAEAVGLVICRHELFSGETSLGHVKGEGSGFAVTPDGHMITNKHVVEFEISEKLAEDIKEKTGRTADGFRTRFWVAVNGSIYDAELTHQSRNFDFAMLKIKRARMPFFSLTLKNDFDPRTPVVALGFPGASRIPMSDEEQIEAAVRALKWREDVKSNYKARDFILTVTEGKITRMSPEEGGRLWISHDAEISGGNSGGPLCADNGVVLGINTQGVVGTRDNAALMVCQLRKEIETVTDRVNWVD